MLEAVRECVKDVYDGGCVADGLGAGADPGDRGDAALTSPFARSLLFGYVSEYLYEADSLLAEREPLPHSPSTPPSWASSWGNTDS